MWTECVWHAAQRGRVSDLRAHLQLHKEQLNAGNLAPALYIASCNNHVEAVGVLLDAKADANVQVHALLPSTPLFGACRWGSEGAARLLIESFAIANRGSPVLYTDVAAKHGHVGILKILASANANSHATSCGNHDSQAFWVLQNDHTAAMCLALKNDHAAALLLLWRAETRWHNCQVARSDGGRIYFTPRVGFHGQDMVHAAVANPSTRMLKVLVHAKAYLSGTDNSGRSPIHLAAQTGADAALRVLLRAKVRVDDPTPHTLKTPLHYAAFNNQVGAIAILVQAKAQVNATSLGRKGGTPAAFAQRNGCAEAASLLLKANCDVHKM